MSQRVFVLSAAQSKAPVLGIARKYAKRQVLQRIAADLKKFIIFLIYSLQVTVFVTIIRNGGRVMIGGVASSHNTSRKGGFTPAFFICALFSLAPDAKPLTTNH